MSRTPRCALSSRASFWRHQSVFGVMDRESGSCQFCVRVTEEMHLDCTLLSPIVFISVEWTFNDVLQRSRKNRHEKMCGKILTVVTKVHIFFKRRRFLFVCLKSLNLRRLVPLYPFLCNVYVCFGFDRTSTGGNNSSFDFLFLMPLCHWNSVWFTSMKMWTSVVVMFNKAQKLLLARASSGKI